MRFLAALRGVICGILLLLNGLFIPSVIIITALIRYLIPLSWWRRKWYSIINKLPSLWVCGNRIILRLFTRITWDCHIDNNISPKEWYFLIANHRSWADILVLYHVLDGKASTLKFFLKQELIWIPGIGLACKALHFPFMQRYSKSYLKKHPEKKGKDLETTRRSCEKFKLHPSTIILFPEATRFTDEKHLQQKPPYQHLLNPKYSMLAFSLSLLSDKITHLIDVTIAYDNPKATLWDLLCGCTRKVSVTVNCVSVPQTIYDCMDNEAELRAQTKLWLYDLWQQKDKQLIRIFNLT